MTEQDSKTTGDRELLEMAAKAAGMTLLSVNVYPSGYTEAVREGFNPNGGNIWSPLHDDADALRLAVMLGLTITIDNSFLAETFAWRSGSLAYEVGERHANDAFAATRRAIVRAAAAIGAAQ